MAKSVRSAPKPAKRATRATAAHTSLRASKIEAMRILRSTVILSLLLAGASFGASKEQMEMQRDLAQLQDQVRALQSSTDQKLAAIQALLTQTLDAATKATTSVSVLSATVNQTLERELNTKMMPVAG